MIIAIVIVVIVWLFFCAIIWSCCKVASDADDLSEAIMKAMKKKLDWQKPTILALNIRELPRINVHGNISRNSVDNGMECKVSTSLFWVISNTFGMAMAYKSIFLAYLQFN